MPRKVVFLDRDGTLNVDFGYVYRTDDWQFTDHAPQAVKLLRDAGFFVAIVTNQSGVDAGYYTENDVRVLHEYLQNELHRFDTLIDAFAYCPHSRLGDCRCRKPGTAMADQIEKAVKEAIDYRASWTIGDKISDLGFGQSLGTQTALIRSRYWADEQLDGQPDVIADSLFEVVSKYVLGPTNNLHESDETRPAL